ncbi:hypothetical protein RRG08_029682 [Elysia crispata]|uniref:Uncharacterized protein n=1 Tax=Elysia crispata TaxID=231223 RepID=A0AAE1BCH5_9GAST|nr:hypothetical protein RRG08_029682 [Elysia crispata]
MLLDELDARQRADILAEITRNSTSPQFKSMQDQTYHCHAVLSRTMKEGENKEFTHYFYHLFSLTSKEPSRRCGDTLWDWRKPLCCPQSKDGQRNGTRLLSRLADSSRLLSDRRSMKQGKETRWGWKVTDEQYNDFEERTVSLGKSFKTKKALGRVRGILGINLVSPALPAGGLLGTVNSTDRLKVWN